jgi:hypothetical protein
MARLASSSSSVGFRIDQQNLQHAGLREIMRRRARLGDVGGDEFMDLMNVD